MADLDSNEVTEIGWFQGRLGDYLCEANRGAAPILVSLSSCDLSEFEFAAARMGVSIRATQLVGGQARVSFRYRLLGDGVLSSYETTHAVALEWQTRPASLNFSIRAGASGMLLEGRQRDPFSVLMYVEPGNSSWAGRVIAAGRIPSPNPAFHISIPLQAGQLLGIPAFSAQRGWLHLPLDPQMAGRFSIWANACLAEQIECSQDELYRWIERLLGPVLMHDSLPRMPSHYLRIIHAVNALIEARPDEAPLVTEVAKRLNVSVRTLQRAYQATYGIGVSQFLRNRRLKRAHDLLQKGDMSVQSVAHENGFQHLPRFSQQYRQLFGVNPSDTLSSLSLLP